MQHEYRAAHPSRPPLQFSDVARSEVVIFGDGFPHGHEEHLSVLVKLNSLLVNGEVVASGWWNLCVISKPEKSAVAEFGRAIG